MLLHKRSVVSQLILAVLLLVLTGSIASAEFLVAWRDSYKISKYSDAWSYLGDFIVLPYGTMALNVIQDKTTGDIFVRVTTDVNGPTAGSVLKYDQNGNQIAGWSVTGLAYGKGMAIKDDKIFITDDEAQTVKWYSTSDSSISGTLSSGTDVMGPVEGLAFDSQGKLFVAAGTNIKCWNADLSYLGKILDNSNLTDVKIDPVSDGIRALRWDGFLLGWANDGTWTGPYYQHGVPPYPQALWISPTGNYYRTAAAIGGVQKLDTASGVWTTVVSEEPGSFTYPIGFTHIETISPKLRVRLLLEDYSGDPSLIRVRVDVFENGSLVQSKTVAPGTTQPVIDILLDSGTYTVRASAGKWVSRETTVVIPPGNSYTTVDMSLPNADVDGDNHVGTVDFSILSDNHGQVGD